MLCHLIKSYSRGDIDLVLVDPRVGDLDLSLCFKIGLPGDFEDEEESAPVSMKSVGAACEIPSLNSTPLVLMIADPPVAYS